MFRVTQSLRVTLLLSLSSAREQTQVSRVQSARPRARGGGVLPYMGYIGMYGAKGYGFSAVLVINRVSILATLPPFW